MPAEASIRFRAESQQARREIQTLRGTLAQLNKTLAEQRNQLMGATAEEQKNIRAAYRCQQCAEDNNAQSDRANESAKTSHCANAKRSKRAGTFSTTASA